MSSWPRARSRAAGSRPTTPRCSPSRRPWSSCSPTGPKRSTSSPRSASWAAARGSLLRRGLPAAVAGLRCAGDGASSRRRRTLLREANAALNAYGVGLGPRAYSDAFLTEVLLERGDLAAARTTHATNRDHGDWSDGARYWLHAQLRLLAAEGRLGGGARRERRVRGALRRLRGLPRDAVARDPRSRHSTGWAAPTRPWRSPRRSSPSRASGARRGRSAARSRSSAGSSATRGSRASRRPSRSSSAPSRGSSTLARSWRWAPRSATRAGPPTRASRCAARSSSPRAAARRRSPTPPARELYAAGARPRTEALAGVEALTASEKRVADLAATGDTNRDIAQALYVTPKTVEVHLSNTYRKLGIRSRRELATALAG